MDVRDYIEDSARGFFDGLKQWLSIPSISADPAHRDDVRASADWLAEHLRGTGFPIVEIWETGGPGEPSQHSEPSQHGEPGQPTEPGRPAVFAHWPSDDRGAPTVLVYGHHDVQPVEPLSEWHSPPFEPVERDGQLLARGASDDKGQVLFHTLGVRACLAAVGRAAPPVSLKFLIEGEE